MDTHIRDLRYFVAVAEELSFTRAAGERLYISQPSLSRQIRQLESSLRTRLFDRDRRTVALTPAGAELLPRARQIIEQWEQAQRAVADVSRDSLTVGFQTRIARGIIAAAAERLPGHNLRFRQISWGDPSVGLAGRQVDVAVAWLPVPSGISWEVVSTEDRWVALPARHRLAGRATVTLAELADEPFVALPASAGPMRAFWLATAERDRPPVVGAEVETAEEAIEAVAAGHAVVLVSAVNAELYRHDDVVCVPVTGLEPARLAVAWRSDDHRPAIHAIAHTLMTCLCPT
ncbi:LysR family transcriptional regulator [Nonomuraea endophytica]|uniref:LysR substrate-binding domain-containing protein n=1 Tax=Nonomuraea endophytica TaxID=714136 RepID=UPI0037C634F3